MAADVGGAESLDGVAAGDGRRELLTMDDIGCERLLLCGARERVDTAPAALHG